MVKREVKSSKKSCENKKGLTNKEMQEILIENFVGLQKAMTNVSIKFESLTSQITNLLEIFELSAKRITQGKGHASGLEIDILKKIDTVLEQNKALASGIILIEEKIRNQSPRPQGMQQMQPSIGQQNPQNRQNQFQQGQTRTLPRI